VVRLREAVIDTASVTREGAHLAARSAGTVRAPIFERLLDEAAELPGIPAGCTADEVAYIGSDVSDLGIIEEVGRSGLTAAPFAAPAPVAAAVHHVCRARGGDGAFQEFAEWLLGLREAGTRIGRGEPVSRPS
jgi:3-deoxy-D-manno-octulosonate 8-phosphate phosphatase (KDO 8-P phosphatase)